MKKYMPLTEEEELFKEEDEEPEQGI